MIAVLVCNERRRGEDSLSSSSDDTQSLSLLSLLSFYNFPSFFASFVCRVIISPRRNIRRDHSCDFRALKCRWHWWLCFSAHYSHLMGREFSSFFPSCFIPKNSSRMKCWRQNERGIKMGGIEDFIISCTPLFTLRLSFLFFSRWCMEFDRLEMLQHPEGWMPGKKDVCVYVVAAQESNYRQRIIFERTWISNFFISLCNTSFSFPPAILFHSQSTV